MFFSFPLTDIFTPAIFFPQTQRNTTHNNINIEREKKTLNFVQRPKAWTKIGKRSSVPQQMYSARVRENGKSGNKMPRIAFDIENRHETHIYLMPLHKARVVNGFDDELNKQR